MIGYLDPRFGSWTAGPRQKTEEEMILEGWGRARDDAFTVLLSLVQGGYRDPDAPDRAIKMVERLDELLYQKDCPEKLK